MLPFLIYTRREVMFPLLMLSERGGVSFQKCWKNHFNYCRDWELEIFNVHITLRWQVSVGEIKMITLKSIACIVEIEKYSMCICCLSFITMEMYALNRCIIIGDEYFCKLPIRNGKILLTFDFVGRKLKLSKQWASLP